MIYMDRWVNGLLLIKEVKQHFIYILIFHKLLQANQNNLWTLNMIWNVKLRQQNYFVQKVAASSHYRYYFKHSI